MAQVWARVRDKVTGHQYDVGIERMQMLLERGVAEEVPFYHNTLGQALPGRHGGKPRPAKPQRPLAVLVPQSKRAAKPAVAEMKESESL